MNEAGRSVGPARGAYKLPLDRVLVVHDEIDLPFGEVRARVGGGLAGHNGLKSLKRELGGPDFARVRVGVGRPDSTDPEIVSRLRPRALPRAADRGGRARRRRGSGGREHGDGRVIGSADLIGFVAATDPERARAFYGDVLGLALVEDSPFACVFDANGTMLRVTMVATVHAAPYTVLGWAVDDIAATIRELEARGVSFVRFEGMEQDENGVWTAPGGGRIAWFRDPDGDTLSLTQFAS